MDLESQVSSLRDQKYNINNNIIPKLKVLKDQIDTCKSELTNCYKINNVSADKGELDKISSEISKIISSANTAINTINNNINSLNNRIAEEKMERERAAQQAQQQSNSIGEENVNNRNRYRQDGSVLREFK